MTEISQRGSLHTFDVIVIGSGIAGLSYILSLLSEQPHLRIALLCKTELSHSNSASAQGGIAAVALKEDSLDKHIQDTLTAGAGLCNTEAVNTIISHASDAIKFLQSQGVVFDHENQTDFHLHREGGHSERRIYHIGDHTGQALIAALIKAVKRAPQVEILERRIAVNLIRSPALHQPGEQREVIGAYVLNEIDNCIDSFHAKAVVLATGGAGKVYRYTSNAEVATGDGIAMAYRAGARLKHMEFYQFHPTLLYHPEQNHFLISEALRGEGGYLRCPKTNERFMKHYAPKQMEMATRDVVARAVFTEIEKSGYSFVNLDVRHLPQDFLREHFPSIYSCLKQLNIDMSQSMIPVVPGAHYLCGGVLTDVCGRTDVKRLFAIGETACTGFHGANRLASNSLLEGVVMGQMAARATQVWLETEIQLDKKTFPLWNSKSVVDLRRASQVNAHWRGLRGEMTSYAGIVRTEAGLCDLLCLIRSRRDIVENYYWKHIITRDLIELRNICLIAELIAQAAFDRKVSIGGHYREDQKISETWGVDQDE